MTVKYLTDGYPNGHTYTDERGYNELVRRGEFQPGHTLHRASVHNEDLSDATQLVKSEQENTDLRHDIEHLRAELEHLKTELSTCVYRLEYAQSMGWHDRAAEAIGQIGELV